MMPLPPICELITFALRTCYGYVTAWGWGSGTLLTRDILFVYEDGIWLHRFTREELKFYMLDVSFEEFVAAHR
jgi:hypothetical protein